MMLNKPALKESFSDTLLATPLNVILNYILISLCLSLNMTAEMMTLSITAVLFIIAVVRKYYVRIWFSRRN